MVGTHSEWVETLLKHFAPRLTEVEDRFVRSCRARIADGLELTPRMAAWLEDIMERCASGHGRR